MTAGPSTDVAPPPAAQGPGGPVARPGSHRAERSALAFLVPTVVVAVSVLAVGVGVYGWISALGTTPAPAPGPGIIAAPVTSAPPSHSPGATPSPSATPSVSEPAASASTRPTPSSQPSQTPKASHTPPAVARDYPVVVLNQTAVTGLAARTAAQLRDDGWTVTGVGNWRGELTETTVYYPVGRQAEARQMAKDLGSDRIRPRVAPMRADRLTVILAGRTG